MTNKNISELTLKAKIALHDPKKNKILCCGHFLIARIIGKEHKCTFYYRPFHQKYMYKLGEYPELSLKEARVKLNQLEKKEEEKYFSKYEIIDKTEDTLKQVEQDKTFKKVAEDFLNSKKHLARYKNYEKSVEYLSELFNYNVDEIKNSLIKQVLLDPKKNISPYKIKETVNVLCSIMDLAVENDLIRSHNCNVLKKSDAFPKVSVPEGFKFLKLNELSKVFEMLQSQPFTLKAFFLMLALTCLRPGECRQLKFEYFDFNNSVINVPGSLMKVKRNEVFRIPFTTPMKLVYEACRKRQSQDELNFLFTAFKNKNKALSEQVLSKAMKNCTQGLMHPHGFRKTARSWFAEQQVNAEVAAKCLDHVLNTGADRLYQKSDLFELRIPVMEKYNEEVIKQIGDLKKYLE